MPKLLQINATCNYGSTGKIVEQISQLAETKGWECYIAHGGRYIENSSIKTYKISSGLDNKIHAAKSMVCGMHGLGSKSATKRFVRWIQDINPDIIHLHNIHGYYLNYSVLFKYLAKTGIPIVWTLHDCWSMTGQCTHFVEAGCEKWKTGCHDCELLRYSYRTYVDRSDKNWRLKNNVFTLIKEMTIVPVSHWLESVVKESYLNKYPIQVIYNGIDLNLFKPSSITRKNLGLDERFTLLGVSSGWGESKGLNEFLKLSKNPEYQIILIGVQDELIGKLPKEIRAIKRTNNQAELLAYYSLADVFVNPSHADSFPTVNLEALACGTPVVAYNIAGSSEVIDEQTGIVADGNDFDSMNAAIEVIRKKGKASYSISCIAKARREYDKNRQFAEYISLYNSILGRLGRGGYKCLIIAVSSGWSNEKGLSDFIQLSRILSSDEAIILVGVQNELMGKLPKNIIPFRKTTCQEEMVLLYQMSHIVASLSHAEAMGLTPIEGMACGKPAIVYENSALPELVDQNTGIVVKTGDVKGVHDAILQIRGRKDRYRPEQCRQRVELLFEKRKCFERYMELYEQILSK